ncbi:DNA ligase 4 [Peniophora sp. CONT]|nr:DNA ligase 4 [Peniophora sp. CONT]
MQGPTPAPTSRAASLVPQEESAYPEPPKNWGETPPFGALASLYNKLSRERQHDKRRKAIDTWFEQWRKVVGPNLYPVIRLLLPDKDRERIVYGMKEKNLAKAYIKIIPLEPKSPDAIRLLNWKRPTEQHKASGDFTAVLLEVIGKRSNVVEGSLTVEDVNTLLDELSLCGNKQDKQAEVMKKVYARTTPDEQRWITRIILRDMGISVKETTVFSVFHPDAHDLFNTCSDVKKVAWELWDPKRRLNEDEKTVKLFRAFTPMLCKRPTRLLEDSVKDMGGRTFIIEEKLDGERIQLHKRGNEFFYSSRKAKDYTYLYGKHVGEGSLTPQIAECFDPRVEDIVLDGELLVWDPVSERHLPFGTLKTAAINKSATLKDPRPCFRIFDMLYLNGQSLIHKSLKFRKRNMKACVREKPGYLEYIRESEGKDIKDVKAKMEEILESRGEGLVLKHPDSEYVLNGRNKDWIKVKPEYMDSMSETLDLLVVAGHYGSGKRGGGVSSLICAVRDDRAESDEPVYSTFIRVGTGLSLADYVWVREKPWKKRTATQRCAAVRTAPENVGAEDKGDLYLEPEDSFLISVKAADITPSDQYHLKYTLRFPRALRTREDLPISDCMTASAVMNIVRSGKKRKTDEEDGQLLKRRKKTSAPKKAPPTMLGALKGVDLKDVQVESDIFEDMSFVVSADPKSKNRDAEKAELLKLIKVNGGTIYQIAKNQPNLLVVYGGTTTPYDIKMIMNKDVHDIIRPQWLLDCVAAGERLPLKKKYFFHATDERENHREYRLLERGDVEGSDTESEGEDDDEPADAMQDSPPPPSRSAAASPHDTQMTEEEDVISDPSLQDWFAVRDGREVPGGGNDEDSATDPESDNDDTRDEEDDWFGVQTPDTLDDDVPNAVSQLDVGSQKTIDDDFINVSQEHAPIDEDVKMGESDDAMTYDEERIFTHLRFYIDTPNNARKNGMKVSTKHEAAIEKNLAAISALIIENGGRVTDLDDPKLTHIVLDKRDDSRRRELMQKTSKPKRRHLVLSDFVEACLDESTLLDEADFAP